MKLISLVENCIFIIWNVISVISVLITIISFISPNNIITKFFYKTIKRRQIKNNTFNVILIQKYATTNFKEIEVYKSIINKLFLDFNLIVDINDNYIKGNMRRMDFHIYNKWRIPSDDEKFIVYTQQVDSTFNTLSDCLNTLFDNIRLLEKIDNVIIDFEKITIKISSSDFKNNALINLLGTTIEGNFKIEKTGEEYTITHQGLLTQETISELKDIIISISTF